MRALRAGLAALPAPTRGPLTHFHGPADIVPRGSCLPQPGDRTRGREGRCLASPGAPQAGVPGRVSLRLRPFVSQRWCRAGESGSLGHLVGQMGSQRLPFHTRLPWVLEKVWGSVSRRPSHTGDQNQGPPFSERFSRVSGALRSDFLRLELPRAGARAGGLLRTGEEEKDFGRAHTPQPGRERWGGRKAEGANRRPLRRAGERRRLSVRWRGAGIPPLVSLALPKMETLFSGETAPAPRGRERCGSGV